MTEMSSTDRLQTPLYSLEKKGKQRFPAVLPEMGTAQKLYVKQK